LNNSPSLSTQQAFEVDAVDVYLLKPPPPEEETGRRGGGRGAGGGQSVLDKASTKEVQKLLELHGVRAGTYSAGVRDEPIEEDG
jgi:hypothetical protein